MADDYDSPWKQAIEQCFADFLAFCFPDAHAQIDWAQPLVFLEQELCAAMRDAELGKRVVDKLARVTRRGGSEEWIYIHLEIQGDEQLGFPERMFVYHSRLFDRYHKPIASLAVLADDRQSWRPNVYEHESLGCQIRMRFPVSKLLDWAGSEARLEDSRNPFALLTLAHLATRATRNDPGARFQSKWHLIRQVYRLGLERQQLATMFHMIDWMMRLPESDEQRFWQQLTELEEGAAMEYMTSFERLAHDKGVIMGVKQGLEQGMERGRRTGKVQLVSELLTSRFGSLPAWSQARLETFSDDELLALSERLLSADSLEAVFESAAD